MNKDCCFNIIRLFIACCLFVVVSVQFSYSQAANWEWVTSTDKVTIEIDTTSVKKVNYAIAGTNIVCWYKLTNLDKSYSIDHYAYRVKNNTPQIAIFETYLYNSEGIVTDYGGHAEPYDFEYKSIIPNSIGELLYYDAAVRIYER